MSDREAFLRAICAEPDDDTPRLVFADWLEENGDDEQAAFVRAQVELARTPPWEPYAVECRWHRCDIRTGKPFRTALPAVDGHHLEWPPVAFRRGFPWALFVRTVSEWTERVVPLFEFCPLGQITFWTGTLDDWLQVAASNVLKQLRDVTFVTNPIEPLWALRDVPAACGITDLRFQRASGAGMPEVLEALFRSPLGNAVRGLHFHVGYQALAHLVEALNTGQPLDRLSFSLMGLTAEHLQALFASPVASKLTQLRFADEPLGNEGLAALADGIRPGVTDLELSSVGLHADGLEVLAQCESLASVRRLKLSRNPLTPRATKTLALAQPLSGLRSLDLSACQLSDGALRHLVQAKFWPNLVELDLRGNRLSAAGTQQLLEAPTPPDLVALVLDGASLNAAARTALVKRFGPAVLVDASESPA